MQIIRKICGDCHITWEELPGGHIVKVAENTKTGISQYVIDQAMLQADRFHFAKVFRAKLEELKTLLFETRKEYIDLLTMAKNPDEEFFIRESLKYWEKKILKDIDKFTLLLSEVSARNTKRFDTIAQREIRKARAKDRNIIEVCGNLGIKVNLGNMIKCPYHAEGTPSCKLYPDHFYSYCCGKSGDVITLVQTVTGKGFNDAIAYLVPEL